MAQQIQVRRDTAAAWTAAAPVLATGEIGYETDTAKFKIGNGATAWAGLPYFSTAGSTVDVLSNVATARILGRVTAASGDSEELTAAQVLTLIGVETGANASPARKFRTGFYYSSAGGYNAAGVAIGNDQERCSMFMVETTTTFDRIAIVKVTDSGAGGVFRLGIRNDNNGAPGTVALDAGTVVGDAGGAIIREITINKQLTPGAYWLSCTHQGNATCGQTMNFSATVQTIAFVGVASLVSGVNALCYYQAGITGALPGTWTGTTATTGMPQVTLRAASTP